MQVAWKSDVFSDGGWILGRVIRPGVFVETSRYNTISNNNQPGRDWYHSTTDTPTEKMRYFDDTTSREDIIRHLRAEFDTLEPTITISANPWIDDIGIVRVSTRANTFEDTLIHDELVRFWPKKFKSRREAMAWMAKKCKEYGWE